MKRLLLVTTAAAALVAGTSLATAQMEGGKSGAAPATGGAQQHSPSGATPGTAGHGTAAPRGMTQGATDHGAKAGQGERGPQPAMRGEQRGERTGQMGERDRRSNERVGERERDNRGMRGEERGERRMGERDRDRDRRIGERDRDRRFGERDRDRGIRGEVREGRGDRDIGVRGERGAPTRLSVDQRTRIHSRLFSERADVHRLGHVDFALRAGVRVPRTVEFFDLPPDIVELVPAYRAYKYFLVGDEIVIVDPDTYEIVDVIPA